MDKLKWQNELQREPRPSLIGMTAFYRYNSNSSRKINQWRWYSMTEIGWTTVLWWAYEELNENTEARNRFIDNLKTSNSHKTILSEAITKKIQSIKWLENITINGDQVITLLEWKELDIWWKKFTIDMTYMFYLLGECWNESIWVNLNKINVKWFGSKVEIWPETSYENSAGLSIDWVMSENNLNIRSTRSQTYWIAVGNLAPKDWEWAITQQESNSTNSSQENWNTWQEWGWGPGNWSWWSWGWNWGWNWWGWSGGWSWWGWSGSWNWWGWRP